jgi:hypothetical protein
VDGLRRGFLAADARFGPVPLWWWSGDAVTEERLSWQMRRLRAAGLRNLCVINLAPAGPCYGCAADDPPFYSPRWWELFACALDEAERLGMFLWFYDQIGFSGANFPARLVGEHPEFAGYRLLALAPGEAEPAGAETVAEAAGQRLVTVRQGFDWLNPRAAAALLDRIHGEMERRFSDRLGRVLVGSFQDELQPMPTWTGALPEAYRARHGEDLTAVLPLLVSGGPGAGELRRRFYALLAELAEAAFFRPLGDWHRRHGMLLGCDQAGPGRKVDPHGAQRLYLDYFRTHRHFSAPGSDMDGEAKPHSSLAHVHGLPRVWLEGFHSSGWGGTVEETLHWLVPWLQAGVTLFDPHAVYYATRGGWWEWAPPDTGWRQPYAEHYPVFADLVARACWLLAQGHHVCDIAVYYPGHAVWEHMSPTDVHPTEHPQAAAARDPDPEVQRLRAVYWALVGRQARHEASPGALREARWDFDVLDDTALASGRLEGGTLAVAAERYQVLVLPGALPPDPAARARVEAWAAAGGLVLAVAFPEPGALPPGAVRLEGPAAVAAALAARQRRRAEGPGLALQRRIHDTDVFLLLPPADSLLPMHAAAGAPPAVPPDGVWRLRTAGQPELWDPVSGATSPLPHTREGDDVVVQVPWRDWPAALVVCPPASSGATPGGAAAADDGTRGLRPRPARVPRWDQEPRAVRPLSEEGWRVRVVPTLDNRFGDFDLHTAEASGQAERRRFRVRTEAGPAEGEAAGWHRAAFDDQAWDERLWSEAAYALTGRGERFDATRASPVVYSTILGDMAFRDWAGRMGRVPRAFLNLGTASAGETVWAFTRVLAPREDRYWLLAEGGAVREVLVDGGTVALRDGDSGYALRAPLRLQAGPHELLLRCAGGSGPVRVGVQVSPVPQEDLPEWVRPAAGGGELRTSVTTPPGVRSVRVVFAVEGHVELWVNGHRLAVEGDFNPYVRSGQQLLQLGPHWREGANSLALRFPEGTGRALVDGVAELAVGAPVSFCSGSHWAAADGQPAVRVVAGSTEHLWIRPRPHPLPGVGWLMPDSVPDPAPLPLLLDAQAARRPVWLRFPLPVGACGLRLKAHGQARTWVGGEEVPVSAGRAEFAPQAAGTPCAIRIDPAGPFPEAAVLAAPVRLVLAPHAAALGDWRTVLHLPHHSGVVEYEAEVQGGGERAELDLGYVRGTAQVWVDGSDLGVRLWHPFVFDLTGAWGRGRHRLRVRVTNTLGAHYADGRPTSLVGTGQAASGLFGPVVVRESEG